MTAFVLPYSLICFAGVWKDDGRIADQKKGDNDPEKAESNPDPQADQKSKSFVSYLGSFFSPGVFVHVFLPFET